METISGDARRALEICRRAAELTDYHNKNSNPNSAPAGRDTLTTSVFHFAIRKDNGHITLELEGWTYLHDNYQVISEAPPDTMQDIINKSNMYGAAAV